MCMVCGDSESTLHAHHLYYLKGKQPWETERGQLVSACADCHKQLEDARLSILVLFSTLPPEFILDFSSRFESAMQHPEIDSYDLMIGLSELFEHPKEIVKFAKRRLAKCRKDS